MPTLSVAQQFAVLGEFYGRPLSDTVVRLYAMDLADLPLAAVTRALTELRRQPKRRSCPLPAEVREHVGRQQPGAGPEVAEQIAARISGSISRFGYTGASRARAFMGEVGWQACEELGGYVALCQRLKADDMQTFFAQSRELCRAILDQGPRPNQCRTALPEPEQKRLEGLVGRVLGAVDAQGDGHRLPAQRAAFGH